MKAGKYAEMVTDYAEHAYRDNIEKVERNKKFLSKEDVEREVDVLTTLSNGEEIAFEVRDRHSGAQGIDWIDQVIGKYDGTHFSRVWICTFAGCKLSAGAIKKLQYHGLGWREFTLIKDPLTDNSAPVLYVNGIKPIIEGIEITSNGETMSEMMLTCMDSEGKEVDLSFRDLIVDSFYEKAKNDIYFFQNADAYKFEIDTNVSNNLGSENLHIEGLLPIKHCVFVDYFNESYAVKNDGVESILILTQRKSLILTNGKLIINWNYIREIAEEGTILDLSFMLNIDAIPEKYRDFSIIGQIQPNGDIKFGITKVIGYR